MVVPHFVQQALSGEPTTVYGDGKQTRTFTHVKDAAYESKGQGTKCNVQGEGSRGRG